MAVYCLSLFTCLDFRYVFLSWCFHLCVYGRVLEDYYYYFFFLCTKSIFNFLSLPSLVKLPCIRNLILIIAKPAEILDIWWDLNMLQTTQIFFQARILGSSIAPKLSKKTHNLGESNLSVLLPLGRDSSGSPEVAGPCWIGCCSSLTISSSNAFLHADNF